MSVRVSVSLSAAMVPLLLAGCHHARPSAVAVAPPPAVSAGPVMVSVPPPTHRSEPLLAGNAEGASIPVVKPVKPPKKVAKQRTPAPTPVAAPPTQVATAPAPTAAATLGQLTAGSENASASREQSAQALRSQRERVGGLSASVQSAHGAELEQVRRFLRSGTDSWSAADYSGALALATKAKVLLDDVLK